MWETQKTPNIRENDFPGAHPQTIQDFSDILKMARKAQGLTFRMLADKSGVSLRQIQYIEAGKNQISLETALKLLSALGINLKLQIASAPMKEIKKFVKSPQKTDGRQLLEKLRIAAFEFHHNQPQMSRIKEDEDLQLALTAADKALPGMQKYLRRIRRIDRLAAQFKETVKDIKIPHRPGPRSLSC